MTRIVFPVWTLTAWGLTVVLVSQLLGGTFEEGRSCQSTCVWVLYWSVFIVTIAGCATGAWLLMKKDEAKSLPVCISVGAMFLLLAIFFTTMVIGEFT